MVIQNSAPDPYTAYMNQKHFMHLDGLRFICIAMVLWHHYSPIEKSTAQLFGRGFFGVDFFFVLSGFLITTLLLREAKTYGHFSMKNFYIRRAVRIIPVYYFVVTIISLYFIVVQGRTEFLELVPYYYLFLSNFLIEDIPLLSITWSLSVEEQYYLLWPLLLMLLPARALVPVSIFLIALNVVIALDLFGIDPVTTGVLIFKLPNATYSPIIMGSLAAILLNRPHSFDWLYRWTHYRWFAPAGFVFLIIVFQFGPDRVIGIQNLIIHVAMTLILIALVVSESNPLSPFLKNGIIRRVGAVSYGIYLYHLIALDITNRSTGAIGVDNAWLIFVSYCLLSYILAEISFRTLEAYFQRFRPREHRTPLSKT